jgi:enamine deaminase RidA (YjgF/YER057c/UK114 family)
MDSESRLQELGYELPPAPKAVGLYKPAINVGNLCYTSGHVPLLPDGDMIKGCVGKDADEATGHAAARQAGLTILATLRQHLGSLNKVKRIVKIFGLVACTDDFTGQPAVMN